jgi:hypothetical protein
MKRNPETVRAFLMRTTALYSNTVQAPKSLSEHAQTFSLFMKGKRRKKVTIQA